MSGLDSRAGGQPTRLETAALLILGDLRDERPNRLIMDRARLLETIANPSERPDSAIRRLRLSRRTDVCDANSFRALLQKLPIDVVRKLPDALPPRNETDDPTFHSRTGQPLRHWPRPASRGRASLRHDHCGGINRTDLTLASLPLIGSPARNQTRCFPSASGIFPISTEKYVAHVVPVPSTRAEIRSVPRLEHKRIAGRVVVARVVDADRVQPRLGDLHGPRSLVVGALPIAQVLACRLIDERVAVDSRSRLPKARSSRRARRVTRAGSLPGNVFRLGPVDATYDMMSEMSFGLRSFSIPSGISDLPVLASSSSSLRSRASSACSPAADSVTLLPVSAARMPVYCRP